MTLSFHQRRGVREVHNEQVLQALLQAGPLSRVELAHHIDLTTAAITHITRDLIDKGWIREVGPGESGRVGARTILLDFPSNSPVLGVIHQAVTTLRIGICTMRGHLVAQHLLQTPHRYTPEWAVEQIALHLRTMLQEQGLQDSALLGIGAGLSGLLDSEKGLVKRAASFGWEDVPFRSLLAQHFSCPILVENNVRAMAFGESFLGKGQAWSDFAFVYLGIGIGAGLVIQGHPYRGAYDGAGEIGHLTIAANGVRCSCGNYGCLETILAEPAIVREAQQHGVVFSAPQLPPKQAVQELVSAAQQGNDQAIAVIESCGEVLGTALANIVDLLNPTHIVLHGTITLAGDIFFSSVSHCIQRRAYLARNTIVNLVAPTFGEDAGLIGAAAIALATLIAQHSTYEIA